MSTHALRLPLRQRPAGLLERIWRRIAAGSARPNRLRPETLSDAARSDLGLPLDTTFDAAITRIGLMAVAGRTLL
jgi:tRNA A37 threonylcarbamoyladenosine synthetase subunit TsaC/SUA5/YrdC